MKKILISCILAIVLLPVAKSQIEIDYLAGSDIIPSEGLTLVYGVDFYGTEYDFIVNIIELSDDGIEFEYEMTNSQGTSGRIKISSMALEKSIVQMNYFAGGYLELEDMTTVWLSRKVFADLIGESESALISTDGGNSISELKAAYFYSLHDFTVYNSISQSLIEDICHVVAYTSEGYEYWISCNEGFPLILYMDLGWKILLKEIRRN